MRKKCLPQIQQCKKIFNTSYCIHMPGSLIGCPSDTMDIIIKPTYYVVGKIFQAI